MKTKPSHLTIYTDGCCKGQGFGARGGLAFAVFSGSQCIHQAFGGFIDTTNNRMEQYGLLKALEWASPGAVLIIRTDSTWLKNGFYKLTRNKDYFYRKYTKNLDLWHRIAAAQKGKQVTIEWVRGHSGIGGNEMADRLSNSGAEKADTVDQGYVDSQESGMLNFT